MVLMILIVGLCKFGNPGNTEACLEGFYRAVFLRRNYRKVYSAYVRLLAFGFLL